MPALIAELAAFRDEHLERQPSLRTLAEAAKVSPTTVEKWLGGDRFPQQLDQLLKLVRAVQGQAKRARLAEHPMVAELLDLDRWRRAYKAEARRRAEGTRAAVRAEQGRAVLERLSPGRPLEQVSDPFQLEVHHAINADGGVDDGGAGLPELPVYVRRDHDRALDAVVERAMAGSSQIAVLVGGSSTGKTRACWEALQPLRDQQEGWRVWHPIDPTRADAALADLEKIGPRTVVWLNEAQFYLADPTLGERVAAGVRELLRDTERGPVLVLATLWPTHWETLTTRTDPDPDPHAQARELLTGYKIKVPDAFSGADLDILANQAAHDPRLAEAAERAQDGQITQYLAGVPVLMDRYADAPPATKALIHAAMDARRLGCGPRLPLALLASAAPGYLTETQWDQTSDDWLQHALQYVTTPCTGIPGILTPVKAGTARNHRPGPASEPQTRERSGPMYRLADYLDQHGRRHRAEEIPPVDFWTAAAAYAHRSDLTALGNAGQGRGLYRDAAQLYKHATTHGDPHAAHLLVDLLHALHPADHRPAHWATTHTPLDDPFTVRKLLEGVRAVGVHDQVAALLARDPATYVALDDTSTVSELLARLQEVGAHNQVTVLADRAATHAPLSDTSAVRWLLVELRAVGAHDQVTVLADRVAAYAPLDDPYTVRKLLEGLREAGAHDQVAALLVRDLATHVALDDTSAVNELLEGLREAGAHDQVAALLARDPATHVALDDTSEVRWLLARLRAVRAHDQVTVLANRIVLHVALDDPHRVSELLEGLPEAGAYDQVTELLARDPANHAPLNDPSAVGRLLAAMREAGAYDQVTVLLARDPAAYAALDDPYGVTRGLRVWLREAGAYAPLGNPSPVGRLLAELRKAGAHDQVTALLGRDPATHVALDDPHKVIYLLEELRMAGAHDQVAVLAHRAACHAPLDDPSAVSGLLGWLQETGAHDEVAVLLARDPATHASFDDPDRVGGLLAGLRKAGAHDQVAVLLARDPATHVALDDPYKMVIYLLDELREAGAHDQVAVLARRLIAVGDFAHFVDTVEQPERFRFGCEPDKSAAAPWTWDDLQ